MRLSRKPIVLCALSCLLTVLPALGGDAPMSTKQPDLSFLNPPPAVTQSDCSFAHNLPGNQCSAIDGLRCVPQQGSISCITDDGNPSSCTCFSCHWLCLL